MLVIDKGADNGAGPEGHENREHADAPAPANSSNNAIDNKARYPGCHKEGKVRESKGETIVILAYDFTFSLIA